MKRKRQKQEKSQKIKMNQEQIIEKTIEFVKADLRDSEKGHDWWHTYRVWKMARFLAQKENADLFVVELAALLHDIADPKFHNGNEEIGPKKAREFLNSLKTDEKIVNQVENIIANVSFRKTLENNSEFKSKELEIVQDSDRLDAIGAIGIARAFHYGGYKNREIYNPEIKPITKMTKEQYKNNDSTTINHFYEKLLTLKNLMNTETAKSIAENRHKFMENFLNEFFKELSGEK